MIAEVHQLKEQYIAWLNDKTTLRQVEDWVVVTTPFLDRHNDYIQVYVTGSASGYTITDDGIRSLTWKRTAAILTVQNGRACYP